MTAQMNPRSSIFKRILKYSTLAFLPVMWAGNAHADLIKYRYMSVSQGVHIDTEPGAGFINPSAGISFMVSGGIDRKLRLSVTRAGSSTPVFTKQSARVLGATDVITYKGQNYYAEEFTSPKLADGSYTITSEILSSTGVTVQADSNTLIIDSVGPAAGSFYPKPYSWGGPVLSGDVWKLGVAAVDALTYSSFVLEGLSDSSGISKVTAKVYRETGVLYKEHNVLFSEADRNASIQYRTGFFPDSDLDEVFGLEFVVTDKAGNTTSTKRQKVMFDNIGNAPSEPFGVYDPSVTTTLAPGLKGFVPYVAGSSVKTNPIRLAWRIPKSNWGTYRLGGLYFTNSFGESSVVGEDSTYVYVIGSLPYRAEDGNYIRFYNFGEWGSQGTIQYDLKLANEAPKTPVIKSIDYLFSDKGWLNYSGRVVSPQELPVTVSRVRYTVEPRPFAQTASHMGTCTIPANQSQCEFAVNRALNKGTSGYLHDQGVLRSADGALSASGQWANVWWNDQYLPILNYTYEPVEMILTLKVRQPQQGAFQNRLVHDSAWLENLSGSPLTATKKLTSSAGEYFEYMFDLKTLPEGSHDLVAVAKERLGAVTKLKLFNFKSDRTRPTVTVINSGGESIDTMDKLSFTVVDDKDASPKITSVLLTGGPAKESIALSYRKLSGSGYGLEYPILFPSLTPGESYTLTVTAQDTQQNIGTGSTSFLYSPAMTGIIDSSEGTINVPAVPIQFDRKDGSVLINSEQLKLADGTPVSGVYDLMATLRSDAVTPMRIGGVEVKPGATAVLGQLNFTQTGGKISLPAIPVARGANGGNGVIISTSAPNSPVVYANINTWTPNVSLEVSEDKVVQAMTSVQIKLETLPGNICRITTSEALARSADPIMDPVCLLEWTAMPRGISEQNVSGSAYPITQLTGRALDVGKQKIGYEISIYTAGGQKVSLASSERTITVESATSSASFRHSLEGVSVTRAIQQASIRMEQMSGSTCSITGDESVARTAGASGGALVCLIQFTEMPEDLEAESLTPLELTGVFSRAGRLPLRWTASVFDTTGSQIILEQGQGAIEVVHPKVTTTLSFSVPESSTVDAQPTEDVPEAWSVKSYALVTNPSHGSIQAINDGFRYTPTPGYVGDDTFAYRVSDASGMSVEGAASITVSKFNYPPSHTEVSLHTRESKDSDAVQPTVTDANLWDSHTFEVVEGPLHGSVTVTSEGMVYSPNPGFFGEDRFRFLALDQGGYGLEGVGSATVDQFNLPPSHVTPNELEMYDEMGGAARLQVNDPNRGDTHSLMVIQPPAHGEITIDGLRITYRPSGKDSVTAVIRATDQEGLFVDETIHIKLIPQPRGKNRIRIGAPIARKASE